MLALAGTRLQRQSKLVIKLWPLFIFYAVFIYTSFTKLEKIAPAQYFIYEYCVFEALS